MNKVYEIVTDRIIAQLEAGVVPWQRPWSGGLPINYVSRKAYRGINLMLLYGGGEYATFNQVKAAGGTVNKGAKAQMVVFFKPFPKREDEERGGAMLRYYNVFALADCEGIPSKLSRIDHEPITEAEAVIRGFKGGPSIQCQLGIDQACYRPSADRVEMPALGQFDSPEAHYSTFFHELVHSTGHKSRLDRFTDKAEQTHFGSESYSREELVAEVGAAMLCAHVGIDNTVEASANYIASWLQRLKDDKALVVQAASAAQKAADHILGTAEEKEEAA